MATCIAVATHAQEAARVLKVQPVDMKRVNEIAALLPDKPKGFGDPIDSRKCWDSLYATGKFEKLLQEADSTSALPFPDLTEAIYMSFYGGKDSETSKRFIMKRRMLLTRMVWAECLTNKGKYLPAIEAALNNILHTPSWTFPAEDREKTNWEGKLFTIGLSSSAYGSDMAQTLYLLTSKLSGTIKQQIRDALQQRVFQPTLDAVNNGNANKEFTSLSDLGNHNPVTLANVLGAAFATIEDRKQRAMFAAIAERYSNNFLESYLDDGYCTEGVGYYSYGFSHYVFLRELLWQHTKGKIDLFQRPKVAKMAKFAPAMEIIHGVYPAISDCEQIIKPWPQLMYYLNKQLGLGLQEYSSLSTHMEQPALCYMMYFFPNAATAAAAKGTVGKGLGIRDYFDKAGVLTVRPAAGSSMNMGATFKGGNNAEQHNHNDIGSYTIVVGDELLTGDVGLATYTPKYFTKERYNLFKTAASYGHNVPLVNGVQQKEGKASQAKILETDFTEDMDVFKMDITSAYPGAGLKRLTRRFEFARSGKQKPHVAIQDEFEFDTTGVFETALITRFPWKKVREGVFKDPNGTGAHTSYITSIEIQGLRETLQIQVITVKERPVISDEVIDEGPKPYTRIAIRMPSMSKGGVALLFNRKKKS
jgi:hypothetical protein